MREHALFELVSTHNIRYILFTASGNIGACFKIKTQCEHKVRSIDAIICFIKIINKCLLNPNDLLILDFLNNSFLYPVTSLISFNSNIYLLCWLTLCRTLFCCLYKIIKLYNTSRKKTLFIKLITKIDQSLLMEFQVSTF